MIYQEVRRIVIAEIQNIAYSEYLPIILGQDTMDRLGMDMDGGTTYSSSLDPSIMNEFATAAMRFGAPLPMKSISCCTDAGPNPASRSALITRSSSPPPSAM